MFFTVEKIAKRVQELESKRYVKQQCIAPFTSMKGTLPADAHYHGLPEKIEGPEFGINDFFVGLDQYLWLEKAVTIPEKRDGYEVVARFDFGKTAGGQTSGFESLLYVDGHPYQGVDGNHKEVFWTGLEGKAVTLTFMLWTGMEGEANPEDLSIDRLFFHQCRMAEFAYLHKKTDELFYFAKAISDMLPLMDPNREEYPLLTGLLDRVLNSIDWDGDRFYETAEAAHEMLMAGLAASEKHTSLTVNGIGHTHIDVGWLWRVKHTREKIQRSFSTVLRLMERYDEYHFLQTQPQLYKYIKEDCPELYEQIKKRVAEGRWEPDGGMWVEADCNLLSGESFVRQLLYGTRFMEREFGKKCEFLWLPDVFGYSAALPQILKQCDIHTFMTTKIILNQYNQIPDDLFWWRGIDGSEVLTYFIDMPVYVPSFAGCYSDYGCSFSANDIVKSWKSFKNKELTKDVLVSFGNSDGGGGPTRDMLERRRAWEHIPGVPHVKTMRAGDFFRKMHENVRNTDQYVHTWDGELYFEFHRGTYTTQGDIKKTNRYLENKLGRIEWLSSLSYLLGGEYAQKELNESWEYMMLNQFHDIIPGSSICQVYEDARADYRKVETLTEKAQQKALRTVMTGADDGTYSVYTFNSFGGEELVLIPEPSEGFFTDEAGNPLPAQRTEDGHLVLIKAAPLASVKICFQPADPVKEQTTSAFTVSERGMETPYYSIAWNEDGQITGIYDKDAMRQVLKAGQPGNVLEVYEDKPLACDAWNIDIYYTQKMETAKLVGQPQVIENGNLRATVRFQYRYRASTICQDMIVYRDSRRIDFKTHVDWKESHKLLKAAFYTDIRSTRATYDIQFGHVERPTHWNTSWDWARFEVCGHKWADLSETGYGVSLLNDCKYGYSIKDHAIKLSLLKSSKWPDHRADMGEHDFTYALLPHQGSLTESGIIEAANQMNQPAQVLPGAFVDCRKIVQVSSDRVQLDSVKKAEDEDCLVVRLHECRGGRANVVLSSQFPVQKIVPCNLLERDCGEAVMGASVEFEVKPFEIKSFKLYLNP